MINKRLSEDAIEDALQAGLRWAVDAPDELVN